MQIVIFFPDDFVIALFEKGEDISLASHVWMYENTIISWKECLDRPLILTPGNLAKKRRQQLLDLDTYNYNSTAIISSPGF